MKYCTIEHLTFTR